jgi:hypothetical protein
MINQDLLLTVEGRRKIVEIIESNENKGRKAESYKKSEILKDRLDNYVYAELRKQFDEQTIIEMPVVKSINICKRAINKSSIVYQEQPDRRIANSEYDLQSLYQEIGVNKAVCSALKYYKLHRQILMQVVPANGKLTTKIYQPHHYDPIMGDNDIENAAGYIISAYDKSNEAYEQGKRPAPATGTFSMSAQSTDQYNETAQMREKEKQKNKRYAAWTKQLNFIFNGAGEIVSGDNVSNELGILPFIEISDVKEYEYWVRQGSPFSDFTVEFNTRMSEAAQVVKMQGFAQAWYKGNKEALLQSVKVGPNYVLKLPNDKEAGVETDFGFATPNADIGGTIEFLKVLLFMFLSSQSVDGAITSDNSGESYASGFERLVSMIDRAMSNKDDFETFTNAEIALFHLIKTMQGNLSKTATLNLMKSPSIPADSELSITFKKPQSEKTETEEWDLMERQLPQNVVSIIDYIAKKENISRTDALKKLQQNIIDNKLATGEIEEKADVSKMDKINKEMEQDDIEE